MGGVEVLHPQNLLDNHHRHHPPRNYHTSLNRDNFFSMKSKSLPNSGPALARSFNRRKRSPPKTNNKTANHNNTTKPTTDLLIGQIKILKRGELLPTPTPAQDIKKQNKVSAALKNTRISDFYAGSAFVISPEPSSLPVPVFFKKKEDVFVDADSASDTDYDATTDLRRLLRLDLS